jgi:hypothetical protein
MNQFINHNNICGSKVVAHTMTKSLIIAIVQWHERKKQTLGGHWGLGLRSKI